MFTLAAGKARTGRAQGNPVLQSEGRVTVIDGILAVAVFLGLVLNAVAGWWWADPAAGYMLVYYAAREAREIFTRSTTLVRSNSRLRLQPLGSARHRALTASRIGPLGLTFESSGGFTVRL